MIALTRLNQEPIIINTDAIAYVESTPDTLITLTNGDRLHVKESVPVLIDLAIAYKRRIFEFALALAPTATATATATATPTPTPTPTPGSASSDPDSNI